MKNMILAAIFTAAPAAAQTTVRVPISGPTGIPGLGASFNGTSAGAAPLLMPTPAPGMQMPALSALTLIPTLAPTPVQPASAVNIRAAAARPIEGSPLGVLPDDSSDMTQKTAALDRLFENSAPSSPEALAASAQSAAASGPKNSKEASPVPEWFDSSGLSFTLMKKSADGLLMAVLRHGRYELGLFLDKNGDNQAIFTKYALNPMGTPLKEEASLRKEALRREGAKILRAAQAEIPVSGKELAALRETLAYLEGDGRADTFKSAAAPEGYTWHDTPRTNGTIFIGAGLPAVSVANTQRGIEAIIDGQPVAIGFTDAPDGPPTAMVFKREDETITFDLDSYSPAIAGTLSGMNMSARFKDSNLIISHGEGRFQMTLADVPRLTSLQAGDVPAPVRRFAAYMLIMRSVIGSWR